MRTPQGQGQHRKDSAQVEANPGAGARLCLPHRRAGRSVWGLETQVAGSAHQDASSTHPSGLHQGTSALRHRMSVGQGPIPGFGKINSFQGRIQKQNLARPEPGEPLQLLETSSPGGEPWGKLPGPRTKGGLWAGGGPSLAVGTVGPGSCRLWALPPPSQQPATLLEQLAEHERPWPIPGSWLVPVAGPAADGTFW